MHIFIIFAAALAFSSSAFSQEEALSLADLGELINSSGCDTAESSVMRQADPDFYLAIMYDAGLCREPDNAKALEHYIKSAEWGNDESMYSVFLTIAKGASEEGYKEDEADIARYWLIRAGENNNWRAANVLALCYENGCWGLPIDLEKSEHYKAIAEKNRPDQ